MNKQSVFLAVSLFLSVFSTIGYSQTPVSRKDSAIHQQYVHPRALSAGNTFSGARDYTALFYNPANLAFLEESDVNLGLQAGATPAIMGLIDDIDKASNDPNSIAAMTQLLADRDGDTFGLRLPPVSAIWTSQNFGIGIIPADISLNVEISSALGGALILNALLDTTFAVGYARKVIGDMLSVGVTGKVIHRASVIQDLKALDLVLDTDIVSRFKNGQEGLGIDADVGVTFVPPLPTTGFLGFFGVAKPRFSLVVRNLLDMGFKTRLGLFSENENESPPKGQRRIDVGSTWTLPSFFVFHPQFSLDFRDILHDQVTLMKSLHAGIDLAWKAFGWLEGNYGVGISQGYLTGGLGVQMAWFRLDLVTYGEEVGTSNVKKENRYYMTRLSLDF